MDTSTSPNIRRVLWLGLIFHLIYIASVFDCYFTSPVVHGIQQFSFANSGEHGEAKRLVLIVGDGLRADLLFNIKPFPSVDGSPDIVAPHLRDIALTRGAFGISHTHVPTESRPGHVAIIAGMYEDVSAVTKGWKTNPVDFDSVFNQSSHTYSFGSPDILPMFSDGAVQGRVNTWCYTAADEDFTKDASELDLWVLHRLRELFHNASTNAILNAQLREEKTVFFLHLLGLDTTGHSYRPHSQEYMNNIRVVDSIVAETEFLFSEFFKDDDTSFIFTADHGMSNIGNHGDGHPDNTRTPLVAWGAGIRGPVSSSVFQDTHDEYSKPWNLSHLARQDVQQADLAPLMAALLGANLPVNSVGVVPDIRLHTPGYMQSTKTDSSKLKAKVAIVNAKAILEHFRVKHHLKASYTLSYKPFSNLHSSKGTEPGQAQLTELEANFNAGNYDETRRAATELIELTLNGLRYLETYDRVMLCIIVATGYLGWAAYSASSLFISYGPNSIFIEPSLEDKLTVTVVCTAVCLASWISFAIQRSPWTYYLYIALPCYFWREVLQKVAMPYSFFWTDKASRHNSRKWHWKLIMSNIITGCICIVSLQSMVVAYTFRPIWSVGFVLLGLFWPLFSWPKGFILKLPTLVIKWVMACLFAALFPLRDVEQSENLSFILAGGLAMALVGICSVFTLQSAKGEAMWRTAGVQLCMIGLSMFLVSDSVIKLQGKLGLPLRNQILGWVLLILPALLPAFTQFRLKPASSRLLILFLAFSPCFVILSISAEGLFYTAYCLTLFTWIDVETQLRIFTDTQTKDEREKLRHQSQATYIPAREDIRIALFFLFFVQVGFFGTGNVASVSSFYLEPVYRLVPIFNPFIMASLLIFKIIAPYVMLAAGFATLNRQLALPPFSLFLIALSLTDIMTITFFFRVTDTGSWLEIGQTISFFIIASLLLVWSAGICVLGDWLMGSTLTRKRIKLKVA